MADECPSRRCPCNSCALGRLFVAVLDKREGRGTEEDVAKAVDEFNLATGAAVQGEDQP